MNTNKQFDSYFMATFNSILKSYNSALEKLNEVSNGKDISSEYGICNCCYKMRYITPSNISEFVSNLIKGLSTNMFKDISDIDLFCSASAKRFMEENNCIPFEMSSLMDKRHRYINPKSYTLQDLILITENDVCDVAAYSKGEMLKRLKLMNPDIEKMNKMYFSANIKKIVNSLPSLLFSKKCVPYIRDNELYDIAIDAIQQFILFACAINSITVLNMLGYSSPSTKYSFKRENEDIVTECCFLKTNDYMIRNNLPINCNIKNIVLQDISTDLRDVRAAINFIMRDSRSPIFVLVNKYRNNDNDPDNEVKNRNFRQKVFSYVEIIKNMIIQDSICYHPDLSFNMNRPDKFMINEKTSGWLDSIAYGNNYLDCNYRRDAMGNNRSNPIHNTLDTIYRIFSGCKLKTNNEISDNICLVSEVMLRLCRNYDISENVNFDMLKEILVVLGEIMTRDILHLYYNNTRVFPFDMVDKCYCSNVILESFVMEDGENSQTQSSVTANNNTSTQARNANSKPAVTFTDKNNTNIKPTIQQKLSSIIRQFNNWVRNNMAKFSSKFNENHKKEVEWINKNVKLNKDIEEAIKSGAFNPVLTNYKRFKIPAQQLMVSNIATEVQKNINPERIKDFDIDKFIASLGPADTTVRNKYLNEKDETKKAQIFSNYVLYSSVTPPQPINGKMTADMWKELYTDLIGTGVMLDKITKSNSDDLAKASEILSKESQKFEIAIASAKDDETKKKLTENSKRIDELYKAVQTASKIYKTAMLNILSEKFYSVNYTLYRDIVTGYKQQNSGAGIGTSNVQNPVQNTQNSNN